MEESITRITSASQFFDSILGAAVVKAGFSNLGARPRELTRSSLFTAFGDRDERHVCKGLWGWIGR